MDAKTNIKNFLEFFVMIILENILPKPKVISGTLLFINTGFIGDLIISSLLCENDQLLKRYNKVLFIVKKRYLSIFNDYNGIIKFIGIDYDLYKKSIVYKYRFLKNLRIHGIARVFNLNAARGIISEELTMLSGADEKYCLNKKSKFINALIDKFILKKYSSEYKVSERNEYDKHFELLLTFFGARQAQINYTNKKTFNVQISPRKINYENADRYIAIAPFTSENYKDWPVNNFRTVIESLCKEYLIILVGSSEQKDKLGLLQGNLDNVLVEAGTLDLNEIPFLISRSKLFIGLDSGLTHMALKLDVPVLAVIGGGEFQRFLPFRQSEKVKYLFNNMDCFNCDWQCIYERKYCIEDVSAEEVIGTANQLLGSELFHYPNRLYKKQIKFYAK